MNMQRNILLAALAVIAYLMILQWNKDYGDTAVDPVATSSQQTQSADVPAVPSGELAAQTGNGDVPQAVDLEGVDIPSPQPETSATASGLISVETDALLLTIDPRGGDIVSLALPEY